MKLWRNLFIRSFLMMSFVVTSKFLQVENYFMRRFHRVNETPEEEVNNYEDLKEDLQNIYENMKHPKKWIQTSGTRRTPKLIPYNKKRSSMVGRFFLKSMMTLTSHLKGLKTFFLFSSLDKDSSLTSELLDEKKPNLIELLQAPYKYLTTKNGKSLRTRFSDVEARLFLIIITRPRIFYATNPSTLTHFIQELEKNWKKIQKSIKQLLEEKTHLNPILDLTDGDALSRLQILSESSFDLELIFPKLQAVITWDGGYLKVFIEILQKKLPGIEIIPMYSMSTEAILTSPHKIKNKTYYLPISPKVKIYFRQKNTNKLLTPFDLIIGDDYEMVISDPWGLKNYGTQDIFKVKNIIHGWPDLHFLKRKGLNSSLTGEKITEEQAHILFESLKERFFELKLKALSLIPTQMENTFFYQLVLIGDESVIKNIKPIEDFAEEEMQKINEEYASKIKSGRLLPIKITSKTPAEFATFFKRDKDWESQFKILPLYENIIRVY